MFFSNKMTSSDWHALLNFSSNSLILSLLGIMFPKMFDHALYKEFSQIDVGKHFILKFPAFSSNCFFLFNNIEFLFPWSTLSNLFISINIFAFGDNSVKDFMQLV